jgi:MFS family permease
LEGLQVSDPPAASAERSATFGEVMASREYRAVFGASALSWFGDYAARAAVTALVFFKTNSVAASAATFAISFLPWLGIGSVLTALAERYSYRRVMILCDFLRMALMVAIAVVDMPVYLLMGLLFLAAVLNPPFEAARSALLPQLLDGDRYVVGIALQRTANQTAQIIGYVSGAAVGAYDARLMLLFNAATFGISACVVGLLVHERPPALRADQRTTLLRETADGFGVVFRTPVMRAIAFLVFGSMCFGVVPEGLAAAWSAQLAHHAAERGLYQGAIMVSAAAGFVLGNLIIGRFVAPWTRVRLIRPFAILTPFALVPALFHPGIVVIVTMNVACGFVFAGLLPATNGLFVQVLPPAFRARAFGVMQSGMQLLQGAAVLVTGWLAGHFSLPTVVGCWGILGVLFMVLISTVWPSSATIADAVAANRAASEAADRPSGAARAASHTVTEPPSGEPTVTEPAATRSAVWSAAEVATRPTDVEDTVDLGRPNLRRPRPSAVNSAHRGSAKVSPATANPRQPA